MIHSSTWICDPTGGEGKHKQGDTTMKKTLLITLLLLIVCATASAGILDTAKEWIFDNAAGTILAALFMIVAGFFGGTKIGQIILRSKMPIYELKDIMVRIHEARRPSSPGGKTVTTEEKNAILKEVEELIASVVNVFGSRIV